MDATEKNEVKTPKPDFVFRYVGQFKWKVEHVNSIVANYFNMASFTDPNIKGDVIRDFTILRVQLISQFGSTMTISFKRIDNFDVDPDDDETPIEFRSSMQTNFGKLSMWIPWDVRPRHLNFHETTLVFCTQLSTFEVDIWNDPDNDSNPLPFVQFVTELDHVELHKRLLKTENFYEQARSKSSLIDEYMKIADNVCL